MKRNAAIGRGCEHVAVVKSLVPHTPFAVRVAEIGPAIFGKLVAPGIEQPLWTPRRNVNRDCFRTFNGHTDADKSVAFTPDERHVISGSADGTLILWGAATGEALRTFSEHSAGVTKVANSPDGRLAYSAGQDGLVIVRPIDELPVDDVLAFIRDNRVLRDFTCEEREQYRILPLCNLNGDVPDGAS